MPNLNEHDNQNEPIPSGTRAMILMRIIPPEGPAQRTDMDVALTKSGTSDAVFLNCIFELASGTHKGKKLYQRFTVAGGKLDDKGRSIAAKISGVTLKAIWDAHKGLMPTDMTQAAVAARQLKSYAEFHDIYFPGTICIKAGNNGYQPKNELYHIITPNEPEYARLQAGENLDPLPLGIIGEGKNKTAKPAAAQPDWASNAPPAAAPAPAAPMQQAIGQDFTPPPAQPAVIRPAWAK